MTTPPRLEALVAACHWVGARGWARATGGNMSARRDERTCWVSESGKDKGSLGVGDFIEVDLDTGTALSGRSPSAETGLHTLLYRLFPEAAAVLHVHTVSATALSRVEPSAGLTLRGFEMQKALRGQATHLDAVTIPIFDNDQDIGALAGRIAASTDREHLRYGFLLRGHGLTCWGQSVEEARRHLEALDFLFECELQRRLLGGR